MMLKLKRIFFKKSMAVLLSLALLCMLFYSALVNALNEYKDNPILSNKNVKNKLSPWEQKQQIIFDKSIKWSALNHKEKIKNLLRNPVYEKFNIKKSVKKKKVTLLLIVSSGPRRFDRRKAIRDTWWKQCKPTFGVTVECIFFTDEQKSNDKYNVVLREEKEKYNDIYFQPLRGGIEFGVRFLYHMVWAITHYEFDYFIRTDDDYFVCLERFLYELPQPMEPHFHWGFTHCISEMVRPEESMILFSRDLLEYFLTQKPHTMRCHPWADQMIGVWTTDLNENNLYRHDRRLHHEPIVEQEPELRQLKNICKRFIGIHGTYPEDMRLFWKQKGPSITNITTKEDRDSMIGNLITNSEVCEKNHNFNYLHFETEWQYEPQRCIYDPIWNTKKQLVLGGIFAGRQEDLDKI